LEVIGQLCGQFDFLLNERAHSIHWIGRWVGPGTGLDNVQKRKFSVLSGLEHQPLCSPAHCQSLYSLETEINNLVMADVDFLCEIVGFSISDVSRQLFFVCLFMSLYIFLVRFPFILRVF
jgi:hypothetical protein